MIREIIIPNKNKYILKIPDYFIGKKVEILGFEVEERSFGKPLDKPEKTIEALFEKFRDLTFDSKGTYIFDRSEATDYE